MIDAVPIGDEALAIFGALAELSLPAFLANIGTAKSAFFLEKQGVVMLPIGKPMA